MRHPRRPVQTGGTTRPSQAISVQGPESPDRAKRGCGDRAPATAGDQLYNSSDHLPSASIRARRAFHSAADSAVFAMMRSKAAATRVNPAR